MKPETDSLPLGSALRLGVATAVVYALFSYGGVRSPDSEVVFRTAEALVFDGTFALSDDLPWEGFGVAEGRDAKRYSLFGPGESIALVPLVWAAQVLSRGTWHESLGARLPKSHYLPGGLESAVRGGPLDDPGPHIARLLASPFNVLVGAATVATFFLLAVSITGDEGAARKAGLLFAFGTLMFPYSGTFFSEPMATLLVTLSLLFLVRNDPTLLGLKGCSIPRVAASGLLLGAAFATHITAILFAPFFYAYALYPFFKFGSGSARLIRATVAFALGFSVFLGAIGYFNFVRFGDVFETGRTVSEGAEFGYGSFVAPWTGLKGLLIGSGKGVIWYCPAVVFGVLFFKPLHSRHAFLSSMLWTALAFRIGFIATRSDWHGGFSIGPRYLLMALPLAILPFAETFSRLSAQRRTKSLWAMLSLVILLIVQQIYFALGEIFSYFHAIKWTYQGQGINVFAEDFLYFDWATTPLLHLLDFTRGPFALRFIPVGNYALWIILSFACAAMVVGYHIKCRSTKTGKDSPNDRGSPDANPDPRSRG